MRLDRVAKLRPVPRLTCINMTRCVHRRDELSFACGPVSVSCTRSQFVLFDPLQEIK